MRYRIPKSSDRGRLIKEVGRLHLSVLVRKRYLNKCEICGENFGAGEGDAQKESDFARFHILTVSAHPRLQFRDENVLVYLKRHWWTCHEPYHHDRDSKLGQKIMKRIIELRGQDYKEKLLEIERHMAKHDLLYLRCLIANFRSEL